MTQAKLDELRQIWRKRVDAFLASGQSGAKWCTAHEFKEHQLWYWVRRFRDTTTNPSLKASANFVPLQVNKEPTLTGDSPLLVHVSNFSIEVHPGYNEQLLLSLVQTLKSLC